MLAVLRKFSNAEGKIHNTVIHLTLNTLEYALTTVCARNRHSRGTSNIPLNAARCARLTWFEAIDCTRPIRHHAPRGADCTQSALGSETTPTVADCRLQGTAGSPAGMTLFYILPCLYIIAQRARFFKGFLQCFQFFNHFAPKNPKFAYL